MYEEQTKRKAFSDIIEKSRILNKTNGICAICGCPLTLQSMTVDHYIPISKGGTHNFSNLYPTCETCNHEKGNEIYEWDKIYPYLSYAYTNALDSLYNAYINSYEYLQKKNSIQTQLTSISEDFAYIISDVNQMAYTDKKFWHDKHMYVIIRLAIKSKSGNSENNTIHDIAFDLEKENETQMLKKYLSFYHNPIKMDWLNRHYAIRAIEFFYKDKNTVKQLTITKPSATKPEFKEGN